MSPTLEWREDTRHIIYPTANVTVSPSCDFRQNRTKRGEEREEKRERVNKMEKREEADNDAIWAASQNFQRVLIRRPSTSSNEIKARLFERRRRFLPLSSNGRVRTEED